MAKRQSIPTLQLQRVWVDVAKRKGTLDDVAKAMQREAGSIKMAVANERLKIVRSLAAPRAGQLPNLSTGKQHEVIDKYVTPEDWTIARLVYPVLPGEGGVRVNHAVNGVYAAIIAYAQAHNGELCDLDTALAWQKNGQAMIRKEERPPQENPPIVADNGKQTAKQTGKGVAVGGKA